MAGHASGDLRQMVVTESRALFPKGVQFSNEFDVSLTKNGRRAANSSVSPPPSRIKFANCSQRRRGRTEGKPDARAFYNESSGQRQGAVGIDGRDARYGALSPCGEGGTNRSANTLGEGSDPHPFFWWRL